MGALLWIKCAPMGHVFARLVGHGLVLVPHWPYTFERPDAGSDAVVVTNWRPDGPAKALVDPSSAHTVPGVVDVEPGPDHPYWVIETTGFKVVWPLGFSVESTVEPYCLVGEHAAGRKFPHHQFPRFLPSPARPCISLTRSRRHADGG